MQSYSISAATAFTYHAFTKSSSLPHFSCHVAYIYFSNTRPPCIAAEIYFHAFRKFIDAGHFIDMRRADSFIGSLHYIAGIVSTRLHFGIYEAWRQPLFLRYASPYLPPSFSTPHACSRRRLLASSLKLQVATTLIMSSQWYWGLFSALILYIGYSEQLPRHSQSWRFPPIGIDSCWLFIFPTMPCLYRTWYGFSLLPEISASKSMSQSRDDW